ncbi:hypothetical protein FRC06_010866, partial [Ceratobasidium sp. 370]
MGKHELLHNQFVFIDKAVQLNRGSLSPGEGIEIPELLSRINQHVPPTISYSVVQLYGLACLIRHLQSIRLATRGQRLALSAIEGLLHVTS